MNCLFMINVFFLLTFTILFECEVWVKVSPSQTPKWKYYDILTGVGREVLPYMRCCSTWDGVPCLSYRKHPREVIKWKRFFPSMKNKLVLTPCSLCLVFSTLGWKFWYVYRIVNLLFELVSKVSTNIRSYICWNHNFLAHWDDMSSIYTCMFEIWGNK